MFEEIFNDEYIIDIYRRIKKREQDNNEWAYHDFEHITNVVQIVSKVLNNLNFSDEFIEQAKIACVLHDLGALEGKKDHAIRSEIRAREYLISKKFDLKNIEEILEAIKNHSDGFETDNMITLSLIFADKLDFQKTRLGIPAYSMEGLKEVQYIKKIDVDIINNEIKVNFITEPEINKTELEKYYFTPKVFKAIYSFANKLNLKPIVFMNNEEWILNT